MKKKASKITFGLVISWILSILFIIVGLGGLGESVPVSLFIILAGIILFPPLEKFVKKKYKFSLNILIKSVGVIIFLGIAIVLTPAEEITELEEETNADIDTETSEREENEKDTHEETEKEEVEKDDDRDKENSETSEDLEKKASSGSKRTTYKLGERFEWGGYAYTFHEAKKANEIGSTILGTFLGEKADGFFIIFDVSIENIGKETDYYLGDRIQIIDDKERVYDSDDFAAIYLEDGQFLFDQLQPGLPKRGKIVFDVPKGIRGITRISNGGLFSEKYVYVSLS